MRRLWLLVFIACTPEPITRVVDSLRAPETMDLGDVPLGEVLHRPLEVTNEGRGSLELSAAAPAPFELDATTVDVPGGSTVSIRVAFRPAAPGPAEADLTLVAGTVSRVVKLRGNGVDACRSKDACHSVAFDEGAAACVDAALADGTPCANACLEQGTCRAGECVGQFAGCDDHDPCTVDACGSDGQCLHLPRECPVTDPCQVARCEPTVGCVSEAVTDGTACGESTCAAAHVCLGGTCVERATPNAALDCRYTAVCTENNYACASTLSGKLRCWGASEVLGGDTRVSSPHFLAGVHDARMPLCGWNGPQWLDSAGRVQPSDPFDEADAGLGPLVDVVTDGLYWYGRDTAGAVKWVSPFGGGTVAEAGAVQLFPGPCVLYADGGTACRGAATPWASPSWMTRASQGGGAALLEGGAVVDGTVVREDAGATALGNLSDQVCWWVGGRARCARFANMTDVSWPETPARFTSSRSHTLCGISDAGRVTCWGTNFYGETSDRSTEPDGFVRFSDGGFSALSVSPGSVQALRGDELLVAGAWYDLDANWTHSDAGVGEPGVVSLGHFPGVSQLNAFCVLQQGVMRCRSNHQPLTTVGTGVARLCPIAPCGVDSAGRQVCLPPQLPSGSGACPWVCHIEADGGVTCPVTVYGPAIGAAHVALPGTASEVTESFGDSCALVQGQPWCWNTDSLSDGGALRAYSPTGVRRPIRLLRAVEGRACTVSGLNGLQCFSTQGGPAIDVAVDKPIADVQLSWDYPFGVHTCVRFVDGEISCWGNNIWGQLGFVPNTGQRVVPVVR